MEAIALSSNEYAMSTAGATPKITAAEIIVARSQAGFPANLLKKFRYLKEHHRYHFFLSAIFPLHLEYKLISVSDLSME